MMYDLHALSTQELHQDKYDPRQSSTSLASLWIAPTDSRFYGFQATFYTYYFLLVTHRQTVADKHIILITLLLTLHVTP
jgi:hypothetical protein